MNPSKNIDLLFDIYSSICSEYEKNFMFHRLTHSSQLQRFWPGFLFVDRILLTFFVFILLIKLIVFSSCIGTEFINPFEPSAAKNAETNCAIQPRRKKKKRLRFEWVKAKHHDMQRLKEDFRFSSYISTQ